MTSHRYLLSHLIPEAADGDPGGVAVVCDDQQLTWEELDRRTGQLAAALVAFGVERGDRVGVYVHKSIESLVAVHGVLRAGAAYVPIDPLAPPDLVASIVGDCNISVIVTHQLRKGGIDLLVANTTLGGVIGLDEPPQTDHGPSPRSMSWAEVDEVDPIGAVNTLADDLAYVMYTSGSTGKPKGIMHTHRSGLSYATMSAALYGLNGDDRVANFSPLHFDMSTFEIFAAVSAASRVVLIPEPHLRLPASLTGYIADQRCTTLYTVPSLFLQMMYRGGLADQDLSAVRWVLPAGEVFPPEPLAELMALIPHARFSNVYGPAEVNQITYFHFGSGAPQAAQNNAPVPIGFACPNTDLDIIDDTDTSVSGTDTGELIARTATMMAGYWGRPDLDEQGFLQRHGPDGRTQRWYRTGDLVSRDNQGQLLFYGRRDNQVKIRGHRVELETVEAAVGSLAEVEQAVVGVRREADGASELVARVICAPDTDTATWRKLLGHQLPPYAVPSAFQQATSFPLTPSGKIDRRSVRQAIASPHQT